jgi:septum formation protein
MIVLASASPRRAALLHMLGITHDVVPAHADEGGLPGEPPDDHVRRLARAKAAAVASQYPDDLVLGADTIVCVDGEMLGKPESPEDAMRMLGRLSGRAHEVYTCVALAWGGRIADRLDVSRVWFRQLTPDMIEAYVASGEPMDKAGSYGLQGPAAVMIERLEGDFFAVMGLPLRLVADLLAEAGMPYRFTR